MTFGNKLRALRKKAGMTQEMLAIEIGVTARMITHYESGKSYPPLEKTPKIAKFFGVTIDSLMSEEEEFISKAHELGGSKGMRDAAALIEEVSGLFAGGSLSDDDKEAVFKAITNAYWMAREESKRKYTPQKYRKN